MDEGFVIAMAKKYGGGSAAPTNASNINSGTLSDSRLSNNVTLAGNIFNGISTLVKTDASGKIPASNLPVVSNNHYSCEPSHKTSTY